MADESSFTAEERTILCAIRSRDEISARASRRSRSRGPRWARGTRRRHPQWTE
jgi:hypothetical protein